MSGSARVQTHDLAELRAFLVNLAEKIREGVQTAGAEANGTAQWIHHTQPARWKAECEKSHRLLQDATETLRRKRMSPTTDGRPPNTMVEQKLLRQAKQRFEHAQAKSAAVSQWQRRYDKQMYEYRRCARTADTLVEQVIPQAIAYLDHLRDHLEKYAQATFTVNHPAAAGEAPAEASVAMPLPDAFFDLPGDDAPAPSPAPEDER